MTRKEYMSRAGEPGAHRAYYAQFVTPEIRQIVFSGIGFTDLMTSRDEHLNDIPLGRWDRLTVKLHSVIQDLRDAGDYLTLGTGVCILKEAARQIIEERQSDAEGTV